MFWLRELGKTGKVDLIGCDTERSTFRGAGIVGLRLSYSVLAYWNGAPSDEPAERGVLSGITSSIRSLYSFQISSSDALGGIIDRQLELLELLE
jgi:hypothetical protein